jgi:hypothetical protein
VFRGFCVGKIYPVITAGIAILVALIAGCGQRDWVRVDASEQQFSFEMPVKPEQRRAERKDALGAFQSITYKAQQGETIYGVTLNEYSAIDAKRVAPERALDSLAAYTVKANVGAESSITNITLGNLSGRQIVLEEAETKTASEIRIFIAANRVFYITFIKSGSRSSETSKRRFFDSLKIE